jgi:Dynein heavy chain, N-terminal region 2
MKYRSLKISRCLINVRVLLNELEDFFNVVKHSTYGQKVKTEIMLRISDANQACENLINLVCTVESGMTKMEETFESLLKEKSIKTNDFLEKLYQQIIEPEIMSLDKSHIQALNKMNSFQEAYQAKADKLRNLARASIFLKFEQNIDMSLIGQIEYALKYRRILWELNRDLVELVDRIRHVEVVKLKIDEIDQFVGLKEQVLKSLLKNLPESPCLSSIADQMKKLSQLSPFMKALVSPYLKENHKEELRKIYQKVCSGETIALMSSGQVTLSNLERLHVDKIRPEVISMSLRAYHEDFLTTKLKELKDQWNSAELPMDPLEKRSEVIGLGNLKKYHEDYSDTVQTISKILSNKHVHIIQREAEEFERNLKRANAIIVRTESLQHRLQFFEDLFGAPDIKKHMVVESVLFDNSSKMLLGVLKRIENRTSVMGIWRVSQIEDHIGKVMSNFDTLQSQVENHLSSKRQKFSRLYLLNDEELLDLMAQFYKNVNVFNTYLGKMFQAIHSIKLVEENSDHYINGIVSPNGETVQFSEIPFQSKGALEEVMDQLLLVMRTKIKDLIFKRIEELMETMINTRLEKFELDKFAKDNVLQPALIAMDYFMDQLIMSTVGKDEEQGMENILLSCLYSRSPLTYRP